MMLYFTNGRLEEVFDLRFSYVSVMSDGNIKLIFRKAKNNRFGMLKFCLVVLLNKLYAVNKGYPVGFRKHLIITTHFFVYLNFQCRDWILRTWS